MLRVALTTLVTVMTVSQLGCSKVAAERREAVGAAVVARTLGTSGGDSTLLLWDASQKSDSFVQLRVPAKYLGETWTRPTRRISLDISGCYHDPNGAHAIGGGAVTSSWGVQCDGTFLQIGVENQSGNPLYLSQLWDRMKTWDIRNPTTRPLRGRFDSVVAGDELAGRAHIKYYVAHSKSGRVLAVARCTDFIGNPKCNETTSLPGHPEVQVSYVVPLGAFSQWARIDEAVTRLVGGFYINTFIPPCPSDFRVCP